jgi:hypothetical protein
MRQHSSPIEPDTLDRQLPYAATMLLALWLLAAAAAAAAAAAVANSCIIPNSRYSTKPSVVVQICTLSNHNTRKQLDDLAALMAYTKSTCMLMSSYVFRKQSVGVQSQPQTQQNG